MVDSLPSLLEQYPVLLAALALVMRAGLAYQSELSWYEYRTLHGLKRMVLPKISGGVNGKGGRDDAEFLQTTPMSPRKTVSTLRKAGATLHLIASIKRRPGEHGDRLTHSQLIFEHGDDQTEMYLFRNDDGTTEVYAHHEPGPEKPLEHLGGEHQKDGDPRDVVTEALAESKD